MVPVVEAIADGPVLTVTIDRPEVRNAVDRRRRRLLRRTSAPLRATQLFRSPSCPVPGALSVPEQT